MIHLMQKARSPIYDGRTPYENVNDYPISTYQIPKDLASKSCCNLETKFSVQPRFLKRFRIRSLGRDGVWRGFHRWQSKARKMFSLFLTFVGDWPKRPPPSATTPSQHMLYDETLPHETRLCNEMFSRRLHYKGYGVPSVRSRAKCFELGSRKW
jgi:hypothetical protein